MRPDERDLDEEIRGHLALSVKERIDRGEDPEAARRSALQEFGYVPLGRDPRRRVWLRPRLAGGAAGRGGGGEKTRGNFPARAPSLQEQASLVGRSGRHLLRVLAESSWGIPP